VAATASSTADRALARPEPPAVGQWHNRGVTSTQTLVDPKTSDADTGNEMFHYVRKAKIAESAVLGTMVEALCGEVFPVTKTPKPGSPVCPQCKEIYDSLRSD
jgi:hypothetical protein